MSGLPTTTTTSTAGAVLTISAFGAVSDSQALSVSCTYVKVTSSGTNVALLASVISFDAASGNELNKWGTAALVTIDNTSVTEGTSTDWSIDIIPDNASFAGAADGHLKFKVSKKLPACSDVTISFPDNLSSAHSTGDIKNYCWSTKEYSTCEIASSKIELQFAEDIEAST